MRPLQIERLEVAALAVEHQRPPAPYELHLCLVLRKEKRRCLGYTIQCHKISEPVYKLDWWNLKRAAAQARMTGVKCKQTMQRNKGALSQISDLLKYENRNCNASCAQSTTRASISTCNRIYRRTTQDQNGAEFLKEWQVTVLCIIYVTVTSSRTSNNQLAMKKLAGIDSSLWDFSDQLVTK